MRARGLTLVELLIVVGIILTLTSLVIGITRIANEVKTKIQCMNNLRQLYLASKMYEQDFGAPPMYYDQLLAWQPSCRTLLICPKDPFQGFAAGGWSPVKGSPHYVPHSYMPQYWGAYWILKGKIKLIGRPEWIKRDIERASKERYYFICQYHGIAISVDGKFLPFGPEYEKREEWITR